MERLHLLLPALGPTVRAVALQQCNWDEEKALTMLRRFQVGIASRSLRVLLAGEVGGAVQMNALTMLHRSRWVGLAQLPSAWQAAALH